MRAKLLKDFLKMVPDDFDVRYCDLENGPRARINRIYLDLADNECLLTCDVNDDSDLHDGEKIYSLTELEEVIGVTHRTLLTYVTTGKLKGAKIDGKWKVSEENLEEFMMRRKING